MLPHLLSEIPGPRSRAAAALLRRYESRNVTWLAADYPVFWERAEGVNVWDADGNRFVDWTSAFGVCGLGHGAAPVREALATQAGRLLHAMGDVHPALGKAALCEALSAATFERWGAGEGKVFLGNAGSDAVEAALKTALLATGKRGVVAFEGGYHGLGYGALEVGGNPFFRDPFRAQLAAFARLLPYPGEREPLEPLEAALEAALAGGEIGAVLAEPVQGRGGERIPPNWFLPLLRRVCDRHGVLLILDEIYTGFHRTGLYFACESTGVVPDLVCLGKGLTGGFPLSACVGRAAVMDAWPASQGEALHTSTFLGNPLGCAMALASLRAHADPALGPLVLEKGRRLLETLRAVESPLIREIRGVGLLVGMELALDGAAVNAIVRRALADGLILLQSGPEGNVLGFTPPFGIGEEHLAHLRERLQVYLISGRTGSIS